jgi:hypothetical protein
MSEETMHLHSQLLINEIAADENHHFPNIHHYLVGEQGALPRTKAKAPAKVAQSS